MNGLWKPGGREPFAAFACDDATLEALRSAATETALPPEKCVRGGLRSAVQTLAVAGSPAILVVDLSECTDPLNEISALEEVCEPGTAVIALGRVNDVRLYRQLIASGIHDYLLKPLAGAQLAEALAQARAALSAPRQGEPENAARNHLATAVIGTRGGVGASTIATSLGWLFAEEHKRRTALLDLDVHFGTAALGFDLEPGRGLIDAIADPGRIDGLFLERAMTRAGDNLAILSAEAPLGKSLGNDGRAFAQLQEEFRQAFEATILDLPRAMLVEQPQVLTQLQSVVLVTELTLASARDAIRILSWLKAHAPDAQPIVALNKAQAGTGEIGRSDFEASIEHAIDHTIPYDAKVAVNAAKLGQTLAEASAATKTGTALRSLASAVAGTTEDDGAEPVKDAGRASPLGRFDWKALLPRKEQAAAKAAPVA